MREECKHFQSRTYASGEVARFCVLGNAPDQPWCCPENCVTYERRLADVGLGPRLAGPAARRGRRPRPTCPLDDRRELLEHGQRDRQRRRARAVRRAPRASSTRSSAGAGAAGSSGGASRRVKIGGRFSTNAVIASRRSLLLQVQRVPARDELETLVHGRAVVRREHGLGALHRERRVRGDLARELERGRVGTSSAEPSTTGVDEPDARARVAASMSFPVKASSATVAGADDPRQPLEGAEVRDDRDLGLAHREDGVARADPHVARADEVDARRRCSSRAPPRSPAPAGRRWR